MCSRASGPGRKSAEARRRRLGRILTGISEPAALPFSESKSPRVGIVAEEHRLRQGTLSLPDISAATMANVAPAMSFCFGFGCLAFTAGVAAPLTILLAGIAILFLANTLSEFSRSIPSTGGFVTFVGKSFGPTSAVTTALVMGAGYIAAISSVVAISGGFASIVLKYYFGWNIPWGILTVVLTLLAVWNAARHMLLPLLGAASIVVPLYYLSKPGQASPFNWYPYVALAILVLSVIYARVLTRHDAALGDRVGSIVADG